MKQFSDIQMTNAQGQRLETRNCNAPYSGPRFDAQEFGKLQTCESLTPLTTGKNGQPFQRQNFLAVEVPYQDQMPCPGFRSFAIMRDPVARIISHLTFHGMNESKIFSWIKLHTACPESTHMGGYPVVNSIVIRQLLGRERYRNATFINEDDLDRAKARVDLYDAFVPLEYLYHEKVSQILKTTVPEYYRGLQVNVTAQRQRTRKQPSDEFIRQVTEENKYDMLLYKYMLEKLGIVVE